MMKPLLLSLLCLSLAPGFASAFELPSSGNEKTRAEVVDDPLNDRTQDVVIFDRTTGAQVKKITLDCKYLGGRLRQAEFRHLTWNPRGSACVIHGRNGDKEIAIFIEFHGDRSYSGHHFLDSHSEGHTMLNFVWTSDTALQASYLFKNKKPVIEDWTIDGSFKCNIRSAERQEAPPAPPAPAPKGAPKPPTER